MIAFGFHFFQKLTLWVVFYNFLQKEIPLWSLLILKVMFMTSGRKKNQNSKKYKKENKHSHPLGIHLCL